MEASRYALVPSSIGEQLGAGATADVFAYERDKIIKIFHPGYNEQHVQSEWYCGHVVEQLGLPVPKMYGICQMDKREGEAQGRWAIVQERIQGESMLKQILDPSTDKEALFDVFASLHARINACRAAGLGLRDQKETYKLYISWAKELTQQERDKVCALMDSLPSGENLCNTDFHFDNILMAQPQPICIDWCDLMCGNPSASVARTLLLFDIVSLPDNYPPQVIAAIQELRRNAPKAYLELYNKHGGLSDHLPEWKVVAAAARLFCEIDENKPCLLKIVRDYLTEHPEL